MSIVEEERKKEEMKEGKKDEGQREGKKHILINFRFLISEIIK